MSTRVLVVDDSAFMRRMISTILQSDPEIAVVGEARNGAEAIVKVAQLKPDVVTLDVEMPGTDGYGALQAIMANSPTAVVMLSSVTKAGAKETIRCLELGAIDFVSKPAGMIGQEVTALAPELIEKVKAAARCSPSRRAVSVSRPRPQLRGEHPVLECVFIGTSTGGPRALHAVLTKLPASLPVPVVVVQHMPAGFTAALAERLDNESAIRVVEAKTLDRLKPGHAYIAPGGLQMRVGTGGVVRIEDGPAVNGVRPAADITLPSLTAVYGQRLLGVLLTGMGRDGAESLKALRLAGGRTITEAEETCVVYGMPRAAFEMGAAEQVLPLPSIADEIARMCCAAGVNRS